jgi:hypothetical protein
MCLRSCLAPKGWAHLGHGRSFGLRPAPAPDLAIERAMADCGISLWQCGHSISSSSVRLNLANHLYDFGLRKFAEIVEVIPRASLVAIDVERFRALD